jgi:hypothetical protein
MDVVEIEDMSGSELLEHAERLATTQHRCEVEILQVGVQHAYLHNCATLDPDESARPGRERVRRPGGSGTPEVSEFAAAELGARLGMSDISAWRLMADGLDLCHRLPRLWRRVEAGEVRAYLARLVARKTRDLTEEQAAYVDTRVARYADGRLTWTRFQALVEGVVAAADPASTAQRERRAVELQWARPTRSQEDDHGLRGFYIRAPFATITVFDAALQRIADILGDLGETDDLDKRRVKALLILSRPDLAAGLIAAYQAWRDRPEDPPELREDDEAGLISPTHVTRTGPKPVLDWTALLPQVVVYAHLYAGTGMGTDGIVRVEGCGPVSEAWVRDHLSPHATVTIRPVLDIEGQAPVDAYEIPERHRRAVHLMTPADTFPFSSSLDPAQIDHTVPYRHGPSAVGAGQSRVGNYGPMTTPHHRLKTFGRWTVKQPFPGIYLWRDPHGALYLVDHTGTRAVPRAADTHADCCQASLAG